MEVIVLKGFDQGTVLYGIRSARYPGVNCYAVIISASCDIANDKVEKIYYLVGVRAKEWFTTEYAYRQVYAEKIKSLFKKIDKEFEKHSLNAELLQNFSREEVEHIIDVQEIKKTYKESLRKIYNEFSTFCQTEMTEESRKEAIKKDEKPIKNFLKSIAKEQIFHYYYLPEASYLEHGKKDMGLIIDLQEIDSIPIKDMHKIRSPGIDKLVLSKYSPEEAERLEKKYFLQGPTDFVDTEGCICSPWREHLMQRFSHDFVRIGIDGATDEDYDQLISKIRGEEKR